jgi:hypothetical protein
LLVGSACRNLPEEMYKTGILTKTKRFHVNIYSKAAASHLLTMLRLIFKIQLFGKLMPSGM